MPRSALLCLCALASLAGAQTPLSPAERHIEAAQRAQAHQDCATAAREYRAAVVLLPASAELRANYGIALYCDRQFAQVIPVLQKALQLKPGLTVPHLFLGLAAYHLGDDALADRELATAVTGMPDDPTASLFLGYVCVRQHQLAEAITHFETATHLQPQNMEATYALGETYLELARAKVVELQRLAPGGAGLRQLAAEQTALRQGNSAPAGDPTPTLPPAQQALYAQAHAAELQAAELLQHIVDTAPQSAQAHVILGDEFSVQRRNREAAAEYQQALAAGPELPGIRLALANNLVQLYDFDQALSVLQAEHQLHPTSPEVLAALGRTQFLHGDDAGALTSLQQAVALRQPPAAAYLLLGRVLLHHGDNKAAIAALEQALAKGAEPSTAHFLLSRAYRATGDHAASNQALEAYHRESIDEQERQTAGQLTSDPRAVPQELSQDEQ